MQKRTLAVMATVFLGLLAYVVLVEVGREEEREQQEAREEQVLPIDADALRAIRLAGEHGTVALELRGEAPDAEWYLVEPYEAPADPAAARGLARAVATLEDQRQLEQPSQDTTQYGLDEPTLRLLVEAEGLAEPTELIFGGETGSKDGRYLRIGDDSAIHIAPAHQFRSLDKTVDDLRDRRLVRFSPGAAERVMLSGAAEPTALRKVDGVWRMDTSASHRASRPEVEDLLAELTTTRVKRFLDADDPDLGLAEPSRWVEIVLEDGEQLRIDFGTETDDVIVAQVRGSDEAAEIASFVVRSLDRPGDAWRTLEVADINPWQVSQLHMDWGDESIDLIEEEDGDWTLTEGDEKSAAFDSQRARELLAAIDRLEATGWFDDGADPGPLAGRFEMTTEGHPLVRFSLHRDGTAWAAQVDGDPAPMEVPGDLGAFIDGFLADPHGEDETATP